MRNDSRRLLSNVSFLALVAIAAVASLAGCSSSSAPDAATTDAAADVPTSDVGASEGAADVAADVASETATGTPGNADTPPTGSATDIQAWLASGAYKTGGWHCEKAVRAGAPPSPHPKQITCSNALASAAGAGEYPIGAANVKELYDAAGTTVIGHAIELKTKAGGGEAWYWFETMTPDGLVANGPGDKATAKAICVSCHSTAGATTFGHDFVFTQVK